MKDLGVTGMGLELWSLEFMLGALITVILVSD
jgi:hypothetical protein